MSFDDMINFENENTALDFKAIQYEKEQYESFLKDVISMERYFFPLRDTDRMKRLNCQ